jgi:hypothetical protein
MEVNISMTIDEVKIWKQDGSPKFYNMYLDEKGGERILLDYLHIDELIMLRDEINKILEKGEEK